MATTIIAALRNQPQLRGNTFLIAVELAHRMNGSGYGRVSYQYLAWKAHCSLRTAFRQVGRLLALGLIKKVVIHTRAGYAWNHYHYIGPRQCSAAPPVTTRSATVTGTLPAPEREKDTALLEDLERARKGLRFLTNPDSPMYQACLEKIATLKALQQGARPAILAGERLGG